MFKCDRVSAACGRIGFLNHEVKKIHEEAGARMKGHLMGRKQCEWRQRQQNKRKLMSKPGAVFKPVVWFEKQTEAQSHPVRH